MIQTRGAAVDNNSPVCLLNLVDGGVKRKLIRLSAGGGRRVPLQSCVRGVR